MEKLWQLQLEVLSDVQPSMTSPGDEVLENTDLEPQAHDANANEEKIDTLNEIQNCNNPNDEEDPQLIEAITLPTITTKNYHFMTALKLSPFLGHLLDRNKIYKQTTLML